MSERLDALRKGLNGHNNCDAFFSVFGPDNQYLTGLMSSFGEISSAIVVSKTEAHFMCDFRYTEQANDEVSGFEIEEITGDIIVETGKYLNLIGAKRVAFDPSFLTVDEYRRLEGAFEGALVNDSALTKNLRMVKSPEEIQILAQATKLAEGVLSDLIPEIKEGILERDLAARFEFEFKKRGAKGPSFDTIALFGAKSSLPHGEPGEKALEVGDVVLLDFGCRRKGYCSDMTRTYVYGKSPGDWFDEIYAVTLEAQLAGLDAVRAGVTGKEVDAVARGIIDKAGFGKYFGHSLGHGVGVEIHEAPRLSKPAETLLEPGMVVTIEPGIYLPGKGGVRIEDLVVVTKDGCDILTSMPKELTVLGH
jgi:Xaa-Pro aminopeptidase